MSQCETCIGYNRRLGICERAYNSVSCEAYEPMTNADRIRAMTDEELAWLLCHNGWFIESHALDWLKSPVEVDNG